MDLKYQDGFHLKDFFIENRSALERALLDEAVHVREKIEQIKLVGNIDLLANAYHLILSVVDEDKEAVEKLAQREGVAWAGQSLTLALKLEWIQAIRKTLWDFLREYDQYTDFIEGKEEYYHLQKQVNGLIDVFFRNFFLSYSSYKDQLIEAKNEIVESLSAPIIPVTNKVSILPLIGTLDEFRGNIIEEKVLSDISEKRVHTLIIDLSGLARVDEDALQMFMKLIDGVTMMGCKAVITGMRPEVVSVFVSRQANYNTEIETKASLQQALETFMTVR